LIEPQSDYISGYVAGNYITTTGGGWHTGDLAYWEYYSSAWHQSSGIVWILTLTLTSRINKVITFRKNK
jgi:hypothetical protein